MIWFRRVLAVPLLIMALVLFVTALVGSELNSTAANPGFYNDQMLKADMYNFIYDEAIPAAIDEAAADQSADIPIELADFKEEAVSSAKKIAPPEWLQAQFEAATAALVPYFRGSASEFSYTVVLKDRVQQLALVVKEDILKGDSATKVYGDLMDFASDKVVENLDSALPFSVPLDKDQVISSLKSVISQDWVVSQAGSAIDSTLPYLVNDADRFTITIQVRDRVDPAADALIELLGGPETYNYLLDEVIAPTVQTYLGLAVNLPFGVQLTQAEISSAIKQVLPQDWVQARFQDLVKSIAAYVKGESRNISIVVDLSDRKAEAVTVLSDLADQKLRDKFDSLRVVSLPEFLREIVGLTPGSLPGVRPAGVTYDDFKRAINLDIAFWVKDLVIEQLPDQWQYTDVDLREQLSPDNWDFVNDARGWVQNGYTFTDVDLSNRLSADNRETLDDVRSKMGEGFTFTDADLEDQIRETENGQQAIDNIDQARRAVGLFRTWIWALWLAPLLLLAAVGFLVGRSLRGKLLWGLGSLFVIFLILYIATSVAYSSAVQPRIQDAIDPAGYTGAQAVMVEKGNEVIANVADSFAGGIKKMALYTLIGSAVAIAGVNIWSRMRQKDRSRPNL